MICIKTDYTDNIRWAFKSGYWVAMEKVGIRIMRSWDARNNDNDNIIFLFSVNGQKSYCGLAEMTGSYRDDSRPAGWRELEDGSKQNG